MVTLPGAARRALARLSGRRAASSVPVAGSPGSGSGLSLRRYAGLLPDGPGRRVVVLADPGVGAELAGLLAELAADDVIVLAPDSIPEWGLEHGSDGNAARLVRTAERRTLAFRLKTYGPVDLIVDLLPGPGDEPKDDVWRSLFFHLNPRGVYVLRRLGAEAPAEADAAASEAARFLRRYWGGAGDAGEAELSAAEKELLASCAWFHLDRTVLLIGKRQRHYLKLRDHEVGRMLPQRNVRATVTTLETRRDGELESRGEVVSHEAAVPIGHLESRLAYPALHLQHYQGRLGMARNQLLFTDSTILPGSFRYPLDRNLVSPRVQWVNRDFGRLRDSDLPRTTLEGDYYHLDCWHTGHFGHVVTEVVSRLWGWDAAKERLPDLKAVFCRRYPNERHPGVELALLTAYGIPRADIVWTDEPVWASSVVSATPMWQNDAPYYVHPELEATWRRLRSALVGPATELPADVPRRLFVSRRSSQENRACRNADEVEEVFRRAGFLVVYPDELGFGEQATLFGHAEVVAGFGGSGLYNICYAERLKTLIVLNQEAYTARYEHLYTMLLGCTTHYFWSTPELPQPAGRWSFEAYMSAWSFDFARNGEALERLLAELD